MVRSFSASVFHFHFRLFGFAGQRRVSKQQPRLVGVKVLSRVGTDEGDSCALAIGEGIRTADRWFVSSLAPVDQE